MPRREIKSNLHTHSRFCDGRHTMEENILEAIERNFTDLGFSSHSYSNFTEPFGMPPEEMPNYLREISGLREKYAGRLNIYGGIEQDLFSGPIPMRDRLDYVIGAVHYVRFNGEVYCIDSSQQEMRETIAAAPHQKAEEVAEAYYSELIRAARELKPDVLGHFDLIKRFNADGRYFDGESDWYRELACWAVDEISQYPLVVEVSTGGISRGYFNEPYPSKTILKRMLEKGIPVTVSSDSHDKAHLDYAFAETKALLASLGFAFVMEYHNGGFIPVVL